MSDPQNTSRRHSLCKVMQAIVNCGPISRASLAKQTGLSKQTISEIVRKLVQDQWVQETGRTHGHVGRTAITYEIVRDSAYVISVDLGGTKVRVALADLGCAIVSEVYEPTNSAGGMEVVQQVVRLCRLVAQDNKVDFKHVLYCVVGVPGVPDPQTGNVLLAPNIKGIDQIDFAQEMEASMGLEVTLENDVNLAVFGEHWTGCGVDIDDMAFVSLGTGIGAGLVIGGNLVRGARGAVGELGYLPFGADPFEPKSRVVGALERELGGEGIRARFTSLCKQHHSVPEIFELAEQGNEHAKQVLTDTARLLARLIATIGSMVNPSLVVMGGSIGHRQELIELVRPALEQCFPYPIRVERSKLGAHAALLGGAAIGLMRLHNKLFADGLPGAEIALPQPETKLTVAVSS